LPAGVVVSRPALGIGVPVVTVLNNTSRDMREFVLGQFTLGLAHLLAGCSQVDRGDHDRSLLHSALRRTYFDRAGMRSAGRLPADPGGGGGGGGAPSPIRTRPTSRDTIEFLCR
jgi:hypothetical protein